MKLLLMMRSIVKVQFQLFLTTVLFDIQTSIFLIYGPD